ncbi:DUF1566 domain-containing protein [Thermodesulfobacteriota bacterium]
MKSQLKSFPKFLVVLLALSLLVVTSAGGGEEFIAPVPDSSIPPANDGGPDGCDSSRFKCVMGGEAVLDNQTGLVWARDSQIFGKKVDWEEGVKICENIEIGRKKGWRLPTRDELITILDTSQSEPALPEGHPFLNIDDLATASGRPAGYHYWTSTAYKDDSERVWMVSLSVGKVQDALKLMDETVWPVRDGE